MELDVQYSVLTTKNIPKILEYSLINVNTVETVFCEIGRDEELYTYSDQSRCLEGGSSLDNERKKGGKFPVLLGF